MGSYEKSAVKETIGKLGGGIGKKNGIPDIAKGIATINQGVEHLIQLSGDLNFMMVIKERKQTSSYQGLYCRHYSKATFLKVHYQAGDTAPLSHSTRGRRGRQALMTLRD